MDLRSSIVYHTATHVAGERLHGDAEEKSSYFPYHGTGNLRNPPILIGGETLRTMKSGSGTCFTDLTMQVMVYPG